jgi:hypothetical protein
MEREREREKGEGEGEGKKDEGKMMDGGKRMVLFKAGASTIPHRERTRITEAEHN